MIYSSRQVQDGTSVGGDERLDTRGGGKRVGIRNAGERAGECRVAGRARSEVVAVCNGVSSIGAIESITAGTSPDVVLNQKLSSVTGVDTVVHVLVVVVINVAGTESE